MHRAEHRAAAPAGRRRFRWHEAVAPYAAVAPFFLIYGIFGLFPLGFTVYMSLFAWDLLGDKTYVGGENWTQLLHDPLFWTALKNTTTIFALSTIPQFLFALTIAAILNDRAMRGVRWLRLTLLLPNLTSSVAVGIIFTIIFGREYGLLNYALSLISLQPVNWHGSVLGTQFAIAVMLTWAYTGYNALIFYSGMRSIPREYYEAAAMDGAGKIKQFFVITLPLLKPVLIFAGVTASIGGMQVLVEPLIFTSPTIGGPQNQGLTLELYMYVQGFRDHNFGYGATVAVAILVIAAMLALVNFVALRRFRGVG